MCWGGTFPSIFGAHWMDEKTSTAEELDSRHLPDNIYASVVRSLYADAQTLLVGILSIAIAPIILHLKNGDSLQLVFSALFLVLGVFRLLLAKEFEFKTDDTTDRQMYRRWENRYLYLSSTYVGLLGIWFVAGCWRTDDPFAKILSLSLVLCF